MLDSNSNKTIWVAVATGIVAVLGVVSMSLFPQAFDSGKAALTNAITYQAATPRKLKNNGDATLTKAANYNQSYDSVIFCLNDGPGVIETAPGAWTVMELNFVTNRDVDIAQIDINNHIKGIDWSGTNDNDNKAERSVKWYEANGTYVGEGDWLRGKIKANKEYKVVVRYHNTLDKPIEQRLGMGGSYIGFRPYGGVGNLSDWPIHVKLSNFRVF